MAMYVGHPISRGPENGYALKGKQAVGKSKPMNMSNHRENGGGTYLAKPAQVQAEAPPGLKPPPPPSMPPPPPPPSREIQRPVSPAILKYGMPGQVSDRDKLLGEICGGVHLRPTVTVDKSAPVGAGKVRGGGYSPPPEVATTSYNRPAQAEPVSYRLGRSPEPETLPVAPPPPCIPTTAVKLKLGGNEPVDRDKLLSEVRGGVKLRKVVTNDRSAPIGVGTVRSDLSPAREITVQPPPPPPPTAPPPPPHLSDNVPSPSLESNKKAKPVTNPALLKLGGKQPVDRDALLASIRGGVKLRKVETADKSAPVVAGKSLDVDDSVAASEPVSAAPPPPPPSAPPPPVITLDELHARKSTKPVNKPALLKLGGKPTVSREELMRSIRAGVKLRKTVTNDKSSAILNDDDSGVKSPGRLSPTTSNEYDDVYGSTSDLSSLGTSNLSSLSNIPERPNDLYETSQASQRRPSESTTSTASLNYLAPTSADNQHNRSSSRSSSQYERPAMIDIEVTRDDVTESEPQKPKADEHYTSPIPTREMIEAEIPHGSASERIKMFGGSDKVPSPGPIRKAKDVAESGRKETVTKKDSENSIKKMVRKFSQDDETSQTSQPVWMQVRAQQAEEAKAKSQLDEQVKREVKFQPKKTGQQSVAKKSVAKKVEKSAIDETKERRASLMNRGRKEKEIEVKDNDDDEVEEEAEEVPQKILSTKVGERKESASLENDLPPVDNVSKVREKFNRKAEDKSVVSDEVPKPGRVQKPSWIKEADSGAEKITEKTTSDKSTVQSPAPAEVTTRKKSVRRKKSDTKEGAPRKTSTKKKSIMTTEVDEKPPPIPTSLPPKATPVRVTNEEACAPREGTGPYRYVRKTSTTQTLQPTSTKNLINSTPKPYGNQLSTTGQTITIGPSSSDEQPEKSTSTRQLVFKPKSFQPKERDTAFSDTTVTRKTKSKTVKSRQPK